jgi:hypothetical protein
VIYTFLLTSSLPKCLSFALQNVIIFFFGLRTRVWES